MKDKKCAMQLTISPPIKPIGCMEENEYFSCIVNWGKMGDHQHVGWKNLLQFVASAKERKTTRTS